MTTPGDCFTTPPWGGVHQGFLPVLPHSLSCQPSQGIRRQYTPSKHASRLFLGPGPPFQKYECQSLFILSEATITLESSLRAYYYLMHRFKPQVLTWDLFWKLPTPLGGVNTHFTNQSCGLFSQANLKPNTRWSRRATSLFLRMRKADWITGK